MLTPVDTLLNQAGTVLRSACANFTLVQVLARGGSSEVWSAHRVDAPGVPLAIKLSALDPCVPQLDPLQQERALLSMCKHPALVRLLDRGGIHHDSAQSWLVMELVQGLPCTQSSGHEAELATMLQCMSQLLCALEHLHDLGWVHADLKPGHVRVDAHGQARLLDLGSATPIGACSATQNCTPNYAAPEQLFGGTVDARTDLYAWAMLLYEWLNGRRAAAPWRAALQPPLRMIQLDPSHSSAHVHVPAHLATMLGTAACTVLERILRTCLAVAPEQRYPSAAAVRSELEALLATLDGRRVDEELPATQARRSTP